MPYNNFYLRGNNVNYSKTKPHLESKIITKGACIYGPFDHRPKTSLISQEEIKRIGGM